MERKNCNQEVSIYRLARNEGTESYLKFDNVYPKWMLQLYSLADYIVAERDKRGIDSSKIVSSKRYLFYELAQLAVDQFMYILIKDMLSESEGNENLHVLCIHFMNNRYSDETSTDDQITKMESYLGNLLMNRHNDVMRAVFFDFFIDFWSGFESCINFICSEYEEMIQNSLNESHFKNMKKYMKKLFENSEDIDENDVLMMFEYNRKNYLEKFGKYVDFPSKYNYLMKNIINDKYRRDLKKDAEVLLFCGALRNTMHNNGTHLKTNLKITLDGVDFELNKKETMYRDDYGEIFILATELFNIYVAIIDGLDEANPLME